MCGRFFNNLDNTQLHIENLYFPLCPLFFMNLPFFGSFDFCSKRVRGESGLHFQRKFLMLIKKVQEFQRKFKGLDSLLLQAYGLLPRLQLEGFTESAFPQLSVNQSSPSTLSIKVGCKTATQRKYCVTDVRFGLLSFILFISPLFPDSVREPAFSI